MTAHQSARKVRPGSGKDFSSYEYASAISAALQADFGHGHGAVKRIAQVARSNVRTARNWLEGRNAPDGSHLILLLAVSDAVLNVVLSMSGRADTLEALHRADAVQDLKRAVERLEAMR